MLDDADRRRERMVREQIAARGVRDPAVLAAMRIVPRERFVPADLVDVATDDAPLPIEQGQTISQPFIVAYMIEALELRPGDRVLEIGTGSGYAAAVLAKIASGVWTIERHAVLAETASRRLAELGVDNVHVRHGDGTLGWPEAAPFDAIVVAAGGPAVPRALRRQLALGGRLVIPVGPAERGQRLVRVRRIAEERFEEEDLAPVRFVPLIGEEGWPAAPAPTTPRDDVPRRLAAAAERFEDVERADLGPFLRRVRDARVVLLGESTHGTSEFYRLRARMTEELVRHHGFDLVAVEADWPDAARVDRWIRELEGPAAEGQAFSRFPTWMWRNRETRELVDRLRRHNAAREPGERVGFFGLDLYSLSESIEAVLRYLDDVDPDAAVVARERYGCLTPWQSDPATYGRAAITGRYRACERETVAMLGDLLARRLDHTGRDRERFTDAVQNARLVRNAERYYRVMYYGGPEAWNLRDRHMFDTLASLLEHAGTESRAVVWAHNTHVGDARRTEMGARGELSIGQLCREAWGASAYAVGFGTDHGTVAAASSWGGPMEVKAVRPAREDSFEGWCHASNAPAFLLPLRDPVDPRLAERLGTPRLERAIGVVYRPDTERTSHYFEARLGLQFDEWIWVDATSAVHPLETTALGVPRADPFGT